MAKQRSQPPITRAFGGIFRRIRKRDYFVSPPINRLGDDIFDALVAAALAKCLEFNVAINRARKNKDEEFVYVSALRGICEDLISLSYFSLFPPETKRELTNLLIQQSLEEGLQVQEEFFSANNPFQPVLIPRKSRTAGHPAPALEARRATREFWAAHGSTRRDGPTLREMANNIGLQFTYDYIYFASSNFVHFNPQALLRMGWGDLNNPFRFSVSHISGYYKSLASFYGAMLFIGYHSAFVSSHFDPRCEQDIAELLDLIGHVQRWPEVVTFEEMNQRPPIYLLTHAMRQAFPEAGAPPGILAEVRSLGTRLRPS